MSILPESINPYVFLSVGSASAMLYGAAKGGFGAGISLLALPLMIYACGGDARLAAGVLLPLLIACDYVVMVHWRFRWDRRSVLSLLPGALVGIAIGGGLLWLFARLGDARGKDAASGAMTLAIGLVSLCFVILRAASALRGVARAYQPRPWHGAGFGAAAGVTSTLAHAAGPVVTIYLLPQRMGKGVYVASTVLFFWVINQVKLVPYLALGMVHGGSLWASALLLPAVVSGAALGVFLHERVNQRAFEGIVYALLALTGGHLAVEGALMLWG